MRNLRNLQTAITREHFTIAPINPFKTFKKEIVERSYSNCKKEKDKCECPKSIIKPKIVEEKSCEVCSFLKWKPKSRYCIEQRIREQVEEAKRQKMCRAGTGTKLELSTCDSKQICPFLKNPCKPPEKLAVKEPEVTVEKPLPEADWDSNC